MTTDPAPTLPTRTAAWLASPRRRAGLYAAVALLHLLATFALVAVEGFRLSGGRPDPDAFPPAFVLQRIDGLGYYAYLPSVVVDGDLDFRNQLMLDYRAHLAAGGEAGVRRDRFPVGVALTLLPAYLGAHGVAHLAYAAIGSGWVAPNSYSLPYQVLCDGWLVLLGAVGFWLLDRLKDERYALPGWAITAGVLGVWTGSTYQYNLVFYPYLSHVPGAFWTCSAAYLLHRGMATATDDRPPGERPSGWPWVGACFCVGMAVACRPSSVVFLPMVAIAAWASRDAVRRIGVGRVVGWVALAGLAAAAPVGLQFLNVVLQRGDAAGLTAAGVGYNRWETFHWTQPALLRTLFSSRNGLFFWSPILLLGMWGLVRHRLIGPSAATGRRSVDPLAFGLLVACGTLWVVNSAWHAYWFGHAFGGRAFIALAPAFVIGLASSADAAARAGGWRRSLTVAFVVGALLVHAGLSVAFTARLIPPGEYLIEWEKATTVGRWELV